jgi:nucleoprotein TPR
VISEHLLTFENVSELLTKNEQLMRVVRKLSEEQETNEAEKSKRRTSGSLVPYIGGGGDSENLALQAALKELEALKESRLKTEEMVDSLINQKEVYKAMLQEADITMAARGVGSPGPGPGSTAGLVGASTSGSSLQVKDLQRRLADSEEEKTRIRDRMSRLEEAEKLLNDRLEKVNQESMTIRVEASQSSSESRFQRERSERLEENIRALQAEISSTSMRRLEMERYIYVYIYIYVYVFTYI